MITIILNFLKNHWLGALGGALILAVAAKLSIQKMEIIHLHSQMTVCSAQNNALENSNKLLVGSIQKQNASINVLQQESDRKMKEDIIIIADPCRMRAKPAAGSACYSFRACCRAL